MAQNETHQVRNGSLLALANGVSLANDFDPENVAINLTSNIDRTDGSG